MPSLQQKKNGRWYIVLSERDENGKFKTKWLSGDWSNSYNDAKKELHKVEIALDRGNYIAPGKVTVGEYLTSWVKDYAYANLSPRCAEGYEQAIKTHIIPAIGKIPLHQLKAPLIQKYYADKLEAGRLDGKGGLSARTVKHHHEIIHDALKIAVKQGLLQTNPADSVTPPHFTRPEMQTANEDEMREFLEASKNSQYYEVFYVLFYTGLRRSEALALHWGDVDLALCQLSVNRSLHHLRNGQTVQRQPKTARSRRLIDLTPSTALVLQDLKDKQLAVAEVTKLPINDDSFVFCDSNGKPYMPDSVTRAFIRIRDKLGLNIRLHDARHTHATLMLKDGVSPKVIQERLGHSSITTTLDVYSHVTPTMQRAAANRFDEIVKKNTDF